MASGSTSVLGAVDHVQADSENPLPVSPEELEFFAEDEKIRIVPNFSLPDDHLDSKLSCIGGVWGPFQPNFEVEVPLWLALALHKRKKCRILQPDWLQADSLAQVLRNEREGVQWQPLPFYYVEIAQLLLNQAADTFGDGLTEVRDLLETVRKVRYHKLESGLRQIKGTMTAVRLTNLAASECNMARLLFRSTLNTFWQLNRSEQAIRAEQGDTQQGLTQQ